jgi:hypothetical protein
VRRDELEEWRGSVMASRGAARKGVAREGVVGEDSGEQPGGGVEQGRGERARLREEVSLAARGPVQGARVGFIERPRERPMERKGRPTAINGGGGFLE